jgi:hypothetical protein
MRRCTRPGPCHWFRFGELRNFFGERAIELLAVKMQGADAPAKLAVFK